MDDEWDLHAVVRSCAASTTAAAAVENTPAEENTPAAMDQPLSTSVDAPATTMTTGAVTCISFGGRFDNEDSSMFGESISFSINPENSQSINGGKRKNKKKRRVVELSEEGLGNDGWAWRKYGQKPIKGSPHPRNYYRCSTSKDCLARKQVEQSPTDTCKFIVSYSGDHLHQRPTHLSSLAGTTRITKSSTTATALPPLSSYSPPSASSFSPTTSLKEDEIGINDEDIDELNKNC